MFRYSQNDLIRASCIGQRAIVMLCDQTEITGVLNQICIDHICVVEHTGLEINIKFENIDNITFGVSSERHQRGRVDLTNFQHQCNRAAEQANLTLVRLFKSDLKQYFADCSNSYFKEYLYAEIQGKAASYSVEEIEEYYDIFLTDNPNNSSANTVNSIINALLLYRMRKYDDAVATFIELLRKENIQCISLKLACLFAQMKNHMGSLFWIKQYYCKVLDPNAFLDESWWYFLKLCSKYVSYESIDSILKTVAKFNPKLSVQSLAYLLMTNNNNVFAVQLLDYIDDVLSTNEALELIERNVNHLVSDVDNHYHRYLKCINIIMEQGEIYTYDDNEDIVGYVYDYIPDREFGFIIGFDLISYFFRKESIDSENVNKQIKNNICSFASVNDEDLVMVTFKRSLASKRSYNAVNIV